jgi:hypothetical protein
MRGLLADVNVQGHLSYLCRLLETLELLPILADMQLDFATFPQLEIPQNLDDRHLWNYCQQHCWVLFTANRNHEGPNSLQATLADSWQTGHLPVLTISNMGKFEHSPEYAQRVAKDVADLMFGIAQQEYRDQGRIFVPR